MRPRFRSFYYEDLPDDLPVPALDPTSTALLVIDLQNCYLPETAPDPADAAATREWLRWEPFRSRMRNSVLPQTVRLLESFRSRQMDVIFARIACLTPDGRDRSLSQCRPGFNNLLLPINAPESQILPAVAPLPGEIVITKTTDSALTGTNLRLILHNLGIRNVVVCGIFTDQCVASTVRSLADESFNVVVAEDACAAATEALHEAELTIINHIYCLVLSTTETLASLDPPNQ